MKIQQKISIFFDMQATPGSEPLRESQPRCGRQRLHEGRLTPENKLERFVEIKKLGKF